MLERLFNDIEIKTTFLKIEKIEKKENDGISVLRLHRHGSLEFKPDIHMDLKKIHIEISHRRFSRAIS